MRLWQSAFPMAARITRLYGHCGRSIISMVETIPLESAPLFWLRFAR